MLQKDLEGLTIGKDYVIVRTGEETVKIVGKGFSLPRGARFDTPLGPFVVDDSQTMSDGTQFVWASDG